MRSALLVPIAVLLLGPLHAYAHDKATDPLELQPVAPPAYDSERGIQWAATREQYAAAQSDTRFVMEQFSYQSGGLTVGAYIYHPRDVGPRLPVIIFNRGSYTRPNGFAGEMLVMSHHFAQAGFIVIAPHYRGSNGWAGRDELGGAELQDLMNLPPLIHRIEGADPSRLFLAGESRGGAMVYMALRDAFPARAAAVWGAFADLEPLLTSGPQAQYASQIWPDIDRNRAHIVETRSALRWADRINTPMLIMHGGADEDIPIDQSRLMAAELQRLGKPHKLIIFADQQHVIGGRNEERDAAIVEWFRQARY